MINKATQACRLAEGKKVRWSAVKRVTDLRPLRLKRAPRRVVQRFLKRLLAFTFASLRLCVQVVPSGLFSAPWRLGARKVLKVFCLASWRLGEKTAFASTTP
ncbi:MAG: hypothetical protein JJU31_12080 [Wenzhouxiangella sp.]|nr:hypothetical protein [Wenzhouxiangella sp.]